MRGPHRKLDESDNFDNDNDNNINIDINDILHSDYRNSEHYDESQLASRLLLINDLCSKSKSQI